MARKCKYGRKADGFCRKTPKRGRGKKAGSRRQAKPTPLFADIVRHARSGQRFPCESPQRLSFISSAFATLHQHENAIDRLSADDRSKLARTVSLNRAAAQVEQARKRGCKSRREQQIDQLARQYKAGGSSFPEGWRSGSGSGPTANPSTPPEPPAPRTPPDPTTPGSSPPGGASAAVPVAARTRIRTDLRQLYLDWSSRTPDAGSAPPLVPVEAPPVVRGIVTYTGKDEYELVRRNNGGSLRIRVPTRHKNQVKPRTMLHPEGEFVVLRKSTKNGQATVMPRADYDKWVNNYFRTVAYAKKHNLPVRATTRATRQPGTSLARRRQALDPYFQVVEARPVYTPGPIVTPPPREPMRPMRPTRPGERDDSGSGSSSGAAE